MDKFYPNLDWPEVCKCPSCGACGKETLEHFLFLFDCGSYMEERLALFRRIRERLALGEECDVRPLIRMVLGLGDVLTHETGVQRVLKSVMGDALPLPGNPSDSVKEGRLTQTLEEKDLESPMSGRIGWNQKKGGARVDQIVSGRVSTRGGERAEERKDGFVAITPTIKLFSVGNGDLFFAGIGQEDEE